MIDIHSHVLYGIDDGARNIEESIAILKKMSDIGYTKVIATPHYIENTEYVANNKLKKRLVKELNQRLEIENIPLKLYLGNEIFINEYIMGYIIKDEIYTLNNTNYLLVELPLNENFSLGFSLIDELHGKGAQVILAHPERYRSFQNNPELIDRYIEMGVLLQGNIDSLNGKYGKEAKNLFIKLLKNRKYFALGSDIHRSSSSFFENYERAKSRIIKMAGEDYFNELTEYNPSLILEQELESVN